MTSDVPATIQRTSAHPALPWWRPHAAPLALMMAASVAANPPVSEVEALRAITCGAATTRVASTEPADVSCVLYSVRAFRPLWLDAAGQPQGPFRHPAMPHDQAARALLVLDHEGGIGILRGDRDELPAGHIHEPARPHVVDHVNRLLGVGPEGRRRNQRRQENKAQNCRNTFHQQHLPKYLRKHTHSAPPPPNLAAPPGPTPTPLLGGGPPRCQPGPQPGGPPAPGCGPAADAPCGKPACCNSCSTCSAAARRPPPPPGLISSQSGLQPVSYTHLTLPTIYSV